MSAYRTEDYASKLLEKIRKMRSELGLGDLVLIVDGKEFSVHRIIVSAASQYFR